MSVGRPYFDSMVVPVGAALLFILGIGPALPWGKATGAQIRRALLPPLIGAAILAMAGYAFGARNPWTLVTLAFGGYAAQVTFNEMFLPMMQRMKKGEPFGRAFVDGQLIRGRRRFGSYIVHAGVVLVITCIAVSSTMKTTQEVRLNRGDSATVNGYTVKFMGAETVPEPNRESSIAHFTVFRNGRPLGTMEPRMNQYATMREPIGTPSVHSTLTTDLYLSILSLDVNAQQVAVNVIITPFVAWIWFAVLAMGLGGVIALIPTRQVAATVVAGERLAASSGRGPAGRTPLAASPDIP
jgi:cytochrome c-type biogenesis protein CcmF